MKKIILDTNAYTNFFRRDEAIREEIETTNLINLSVITLGELYAGFRKGTKKNKNIKMLYEFLARPSVRSIPISEETAAIYGEIKDGLRKAGTPLPANDIWIAANAIEIGAKLITYDRHFLKIPGLRVWDGLKQ